MRRPTLIILVAMTLTIAVAAVIQLNQLSPAVPFDGPSVTGELPGALRFLPAQGWTVVDSGGPIEGEPSDDGVQLAIAATEPADPAAIVRSGDRDGDGALDTWIDPRPTAGLPDGAIIISAAITDPDGLPTQPNATYPATTLPLSLGDTCVRGGREGLPADLINCRVDAWFAGHRPQIRAYIGDEASVDEAERQLRRLVVPPATSAAAG